MNANTDDSIFAYFKIILLFLSFCAQLRQQNKQIIPN